MFSNLLKDILLLASEVRETLHVCNLNLDFDIMYNYVLYGRTSLTAGMPNDVTFLKCFEKINKVMPWSCGFSLLVGFNNAKQTIRSPERYATCLEHLWMASALELQCAAKHYQSLRLWQTLFNAKQLTSGVLQHKWWASYCAQKLKKNFLNSIKVIFPLNFPREVIVCEYKQAILTK